MDHALRCCARSARWIDWQTQAHPGWLGAGLH